MNSLISLVSGSTGVMIFFSISGFLITSLLITEKQTTGRIHFKNFFARRFLRLLPPLLVFFAVIAVLMAFNLVSRNYMSLALSFFYLYNFVPYNYFVGELGHTWSLAVEEQFYFFWPLIISRVKSFNKALLVSATIIVLCIIANYALLLPIHFNNKAHHLNSYFFVDRWFIPACLPIMVGALVSIVLFIYPVRLRQMLYQNYLFLMIPLLLFTLKLIFPQASPQLFFVIQPISVSLFLLWIYFNQHNYLVAFLELKPIAFLGKISYGVYVYQGLFLTTGPGGTLTIQRFPLNIILVFLSAIASYYLIEKKVLKFKSKFKAANVLIK